MDWDKLRVFHAVAEKSITDSDRKKMDETIQAAVDDPSAATDAVELQKRVAALEQAQQEVDALYARWAELER